MKTTLALSALCVIFASSLTSAALPPYWDSVKQIEALTQASEVADVLSGQIVAIRRVDATTFEVNTEFCQATVALEAHAPDHPGPTTYTFKKVLKSYCE